MKTSLTLMLSCYKGTQPEFLHNTRASLVASLGQKTNGSIHSLLAFFFNSPYDSNSALLIKPVVMCGIFCSNRYILQFASKDPTRIARRKFDKTAPTTSIMMWNFPLTGSPLTLLLHSTNALSTVSLHFACMLFILPHTGAFFHTVSFSLSSCLVSLVCVEFLFFGSFLVIFLSNVRQRENARPRLQASLPVLLSKSTGSGSHFHSGL